MKLIIFNAENVDQWEMYVPEELQGTDVIDYLYSNFKKATHRQTLLQEIQEETIIQQDVYEN